MGFLSRIFRPSSVKADEGQYRDGPWHLPITGGTLSHHVGRYLNWWQMGHDPTSIGRTAMVQACISAYAQTVAMCPGSHWQTLDNGGRERVTTSALSRILRRPNAYQTPSDLFMNLVASLYQHGNAYALAVRNNRFEIEELHLMGAASSGVRLAVTGEPFYFLSGNELIERQFDAMGAPDALSAVPARDVLHVRLETPRHPLKGESPLTSVMLDLAVSSSMAQQAISFYENQSRPSGTLSTDTILTREQVLELRERWNEQSQGLNAGGVPILTAGLKWSPMATSARDAQYAEILKLTDQNIALAFRMPLQVLGIGGSTFATTELLMQSWIAMGLGFALNHVEMAFDQLFGLRGVPEEYTELDTSVLLRSAFAERIEGLTRGVIGGLYAPNEARAHMDLPAVEFGDEPRVQQQVVPLSFTGDQPRPDENVPAPQEPAPSEGEEDAGNEQRNYEQIIFAAARRHESLTS